MCPSLLHMLLVEANKLFSRICSRPSYHHFHGLGCRQKDPCKGKNQFKNTVTSGESGQTKYSPWTTWLHHESRKECVIIINNLSDVCSDDSKSTGIADAAVLGLCTLTTAFISDELELGLTVQHLHRSHDDADRMSTTDGICSISKSIKPSLVTASFASIDTSEINLLDTLMNWWISWWL